MASKQSPRANVLAVDDKPANLLALEAVLDSECNVVRAASGAEALSVLEARDDIDVILLDVEMPDMDGFETANRIKRLRDCHDIPIIFITAVYYEDPHIKQGYAAGGIDYFGKPFNPDILRMKVGIYASFRQRAHVLKQRELQLRASEELLKVGRKLSSVLERLPVGVLISDRDGRICQATEEVSRILGSVDLTDSDGYGDTLGWWDAAEQIIKDKRGALARAIRDGESSHGEAVDTRCFDGSMGTTVTSTTPLRGVDNEIVGAVILIQDVTETKGIEETLEQRVAKLIGVGLEFEQSATP